MSIINEALKKTQRLLEQRTKPQPTPIAPREGSKKNPLLWTATSLVFIGFLGCSIALIHILLLKSTKLETTSQEKQEAPKPVAIKKITPAIKPSAPPPKSAIHKNLILNGIIAMDEEPFALINNQIYKEGDYVNGKRIISIRVDKVEIYDMGEIVTLSIK